MAEASPTFSSGLDEEELMCGICYESYDVSDHLPKFLVCHHSFCVSCLQEYAKAGKISCPNKCPEVTQVPGKKAEALKNNFYIMPKVQKIVLAKKQAEELRANIKRNWAEAVAFRRQSLKRLESIRDSLRLLEGRIQREMEDHSQAVAIGQSLLDDHPNNNKDMKLFSKEKSEAELKESVKELEQARRLLDQLCLVEGFACRLVPIDPSAPSSVSYNVRGPGTRPLALDRAVSGHQKNKPEVNASSSLLAYTLHVLQEHDLWVPSAEINGVQWGTRRAHSISESSDSSSDEEEYLESLRRVFLRFQINQGPVTDPVVIRLHSDEAPRMCNAFEQYCLNAGSSMHYKGSRVFKIDRGRSISAGRFKDVIYPPESIAMRNEHHSRYVVDSSDLPERAGAVRMRHRGRCERGVFACSEFSILCSDYSPDDHVNDMLTTVFGYVEKGLEVCDRISRMDPEKDNIVIVSCGL